MGLQVAAGSALGDLLGYVVGAEAARGSELAHAAGLGLGDDGECDGLGAVTAEVEADGGVEAGAALGYGEAGDCGGFADQQAGAVARAEEAEVARELSSRTAARRSRSCS